VKAVACFHTAEKIKQIVVEIVLWVAFMIELVLKALQRDWFTGRFKVDRFCGTVMTMCALFSALKLG